MFVRTTSLTFDVSTVDVFEDLLWLHTESVNRHMQFADVLPVLKTRVLSAYRHFVRPQKRKLDNESIPEKRKCRTGEVSVDLA